MAPGEPIVEKRHGDAFIDTSLPSVLATLEADRIIAAGMQTDFCVTKTIDGALERGHRVTLVADGHATYDSQERSEEQIREAMHEHTGARGGRVLPASELLREI